MAIFFFILMYLSSAIISIQRCGSYILQTPSLDYGLEEGSYKLK